MAASTSKKVTIIRFDREPLAGYVNPAVFLQPAGVELLTAAGAVISVPYAEVKSVRFVKEFPSGKGIPERQAFQTRPKSEGLWVRMHFRDGDCLEGILPNNLLQLESSGFTVAPPETSNTQKVYVPRTALAGIQVLGVIGSPLSRKRTKAAAERRQIGLFETAPTEE